MNESCGSLIYSLTEGRLRREGILDETISVLPRSPKANTVSDLVTSMRGYLQDQTFPVMTQQPHQEVMQLFAKGEPEHPPQHVEARREIVGNRLC